MPEPHKPHPNLSDEINKQIAEGELLGGAHLSKLAVGKSLRITTQNRVYTLKRIAPEGRPLAFSIVGHPLYCPHPTPCNVHGSTWGGSLIKTGFVGRDMHLEFSTPAHPVIYTSIINEVTEDA